jgi:hypothetical protein
LQPLMIKRRMLPSSPHPSSMPAMISRSLGIRLSWQDSQFLTLILSMSRLCSNQMSRWSAILSQVKTKARILDLSPMTMFPNAGPHNSKIKMTLRNRKRIPLRLRSPRPRFS